MTKLTNKSFESVSFEEVTLKFILFLPSTEMNKDICDGTHFAVENVASLVQYKEFLVQE